MPSYVVTLLIPNVQKSTSVVRGRQVWFKTPMTTCIKLFLYCFKVLKVEQNLLWEETTVPHPGVAQLSTEFCQFYTGRN